MDKAQAMHSFFSSFNLKAYDEASVPTGDDAPNFPYITYRITIDNYENPVSVICSIWYRSSSWVGAESKLAEITNAIDGKTIPIDGGGRLWIMRGVPFAQRMGDESDNMIKRYYINLTVNYLTEK